MERLLEVVNIPRKLQDQGSTLQFKREKDLHMEWVEEMIKAELLTVPAQEPTTQTWIQLKSQLQA